MLTPLGANLWFADGGTVSFFGFDYPTRMVVVRLADGGLWLWSPIDPSEPLEREVRALGPVRHLVSPNKLHHLFLEAWKAKFPEAKLWGPPSTVSRFPKLHFSGVLTDRPPADWAGEIDQYYFPNSPLLDELMFFHRQSRTAIIADLSQPFSEEFLKEHWPWWLRPIARAAGMVERWGYPPLEVRLTFRNRSAARAKLCSLIDESPDHVVVAHGEVAKSDGEAFLRRAFSWLLRVTPAR
ncbi:MAG TPA: DUF4336 domain-containing protein [Sphingomicrobium sp.]|nr:DUF4336 domain-containing protein [Sphingomicrobium sp.]